MKKPEIAGTLSFARPTYAPIPLAILNNGHNVQVKNTVAGSVVIDGVKYELAQFHFHSPSEHTIGGKSFDLEMHLVHKTADGKIAVIGLMFTKGQENKVLKPIWDALPTDVSRLADLALLREATLERDPAGLAH